MRSTIVMQNGVIFSESIARNIAVDDGFYGIQNGFKEGERTTKKAIIQSNTTTNIKDMRNMICIKFIYNISYGKHVKAPAQRVKNVDNDSGLLSK